MRSGRFKKGLDEAMRRLNASIDFDRRLYAEDIEGSLAWTEALRASGLLDAGEEKSIREGLEKIRAEIEAGRFVFSEELEDIHMNVEARLTSLIGAAGEKLHTGRSRNDQVATDFRLYVKRAAKGTARDVSRVVEAMAGLAEREVGLNPCFLPITCSPTRKCCSETASASCGQRTRPTPVPSARGRALETNLALIVSFCAPVSVLRASRATRWTP